MISKFKEIYREVEAVKYDGNNTEEIRDFMKNDYYSCSFADDVFNIWLHVTVFEVDTYVVLKIGEWLVRDEYGHYVSYPNEIFNLKYKPD